MLNYGEVFLQGRSKAEVFLSTYVCHPSMANNELSGPSVVTFILKWLRTIDRKFSYRAVFIPETIGSIVYLSKNLDHLKEAMIAGFNITCIGDDRNYSYLPSRNGNTLADRLARHVLKHEVSSFKSYSFLDRGSDERQYCSPGVDLPVASLMRSKYGEYEEYHTSLDNFDLVTASGLEGGYQVLKRCVESIESLKKPKVTTPCEPQLGKRGLYPQLSTKDTKRIVSNLMNCIAYCDGQLDTLEIAEIVGLPHWEVIELLLPLFKNGLVEEVESVNFV